MVLEDFISSLRAKLFTTSTRKQMTQNKSSFKSENLVVDWISFNIQGLTDSQTIAAGLSKHFTPHVIIDGESNISYHGLKKKYKVSIRQHTGSKGYWVGTQIIFSGKDAAHCYNLIKTQKFDWKILRWISIL
jgi:hypothetical protein